ncbi:uncharacterized protein V1510DRAFT_426802 [Dipodascopsis tothii]|uniref:uncharacterized protein n=1 Tax=Dipodascopsis tothii TaxID=44089 RepID=UPI0034CFA33D
MSPVVETVTSRKVLTNACQEMAAKVESFLHKPYTGEATTEILEATRAKVNQSLKIISEGLESYSFEELALSFNGGKDCLVLLVLLLASMHNHHRIKHTLYDKEHLQTLYIKTRNTFPEVDDFVDECIKTYSLDLVSISASMKSALQSYLDLKPHVQSIFVGTRRTDPNGAELKYFDPTDQDWPRFMRIHPVLEWHYQEIWVFLRAIDVKYCPLYDLGYTSLGGTKDTYPNPALQEKGDFRPAYALLDDDKERLGRETK